MKYSLFFVEDELTIREKIRESITWEETDFEYLGDAGDGETALERISVLTPDIVVTDIKMPKMDGLALAKALQYESPETAVVILSGYNDFEFAQQAISLNVAAYLLKPITPLKLLRELNSVAIKIERRKENANTVTKFLDEFHGLNSQPGAQINTKSLYEFLKCGSVADIDCFLDANLSPLIPQMQSTLFAIVTYSHIVLVIKEFMNEYQLDTGILPNMMFTESMNGDTIRKQCAILLSAVLEARDEHIGNPKKDIAKLVKDTIDNEFVKEEISLSYLANKVNISSSYLSSIFKQEYGVTISAYITECRIEKAKELLKTTMMRTSEISNAVGYPDSNYFSVVFKKYTAMTPRDYKSKK